MACNCATKEELDRLYKLYGEKKNDTTGLTLEDYIKRGFYAFLTICGWIVVFPLMFLGMLVFLFWKEPKDRKINVQNFNLLKILHLGKYDGK